MPRGKRLGLQDRQRVFDLANQGLTTRQIAQRMDIPLVLAQRTLAKGLLHCARCGRVIASGDLCSVCTMPAKAPLGQRLKIFRTTAGFSQERLASHIDASVQRVRYWEEGRKQPADHELRTLAEALGLTVQELTGTGESQEGV